MPYKCQNFCDGQVLKAENLNCMEQCLAGLDASASIACEATGEIITVADASDRVLQGLTIYGKTTQNGTPTPSAPVPLESAGESGTIGVMVAGKNLWSAGSPLTVTRQREFPCSLAAGTYTMSAVVTSTDTDSEMCMVYDATNSKILGNLYRDTRRSLKFTLDKPTSAIVLYASSSSNLSAGDTATYTDMQVEMGSAATDYEPYKGQTLTASTPGGLDGVADVADEVEFARGVRVKNFHVVDLGEVNWELWYNAEYDHYYFLASGFPSAKDVTTIYSVPIGLCSCYELKKLYGGGNSMIQMKKTGIFVDSNGKIYIKDERFDSADADVTAFTESLRGQKFIYAMAEPIETALSAEELVQYAALHSHKPNTTVFNDGGAEVKLFYVADTKTYIDNKFAAISAALLNT